MSPKRKLSRNFPDKLGFVALVLFVLWGICYPSSRADHPATQPTLGQQIDAALAAKDVQIAALNARLFDLQKPSPAIAVASGGLTIVSPGSDIAPLLNSGKPGDFYCLPGQVYRCIGSPTLKADQHWYGNGATVQFALAPGAAACLVLESAHAEFDRFTFTGGGVFRVRGPGGAGAPRIPGVPTAPGYPDWTPQGNVIRDCTFDASMAELCIQGNAVGTLVTDCTFGRMQGDCIYNTGLHTVVAFCRFPDGANGEHQFRNERDGQLVAEDTVLAFNWFDNRTSPNGKEDVTIREGLGCTLVGNVLMGWGSAAQNPGDGQPHGSPVYLRSNIFPTRHERNGTYGSIFQADPQTTVYADGNYLAASRLAGAISVYQSGNLITRSNFVIDPPPVYKQLFVGLGVGSTPFAGQVEEIGGGSLLIHSPVPTTQPATQAAPATKGGST